MSFKDVLDEGGQVFLQLPPDYPLTQLQTLSEKLRKSAYLIPGYIPAEAGFLDVRTLIYSQFLEKFETHILPDRNIVTRMAKIAKNGFPPHPNKPDMAAAELMAMAQIVDWQIEPSVAFHELAWREGNERALDELSWFRAADTAQPLAWINVALGNAKSLDLNHAEEAERRDLARRLSRWSRNYAVCLKIAMLELNEMPPIDRFRALLDWMINDFFLAGPALLFSIVYFAPRSRRGGMIKNLRSPDRNRAISGVANAAWDVTYLSDFTTKVRDNDFEKQQFVLATADRSLAEVARLLFVGSESEYPVDEFAKHFSNFWPPTSARTIAQEMVDAIETTRNRPPPGSQTGAINPIPQIIKQGESFVRRWK